MIIDTVETLPCLLLPVEEKMLLLPTAAVAEIISYKESEIEVLSDVPAWFLGMLNWRGTQIPLTTLENMESYLSWDNIKGQKSETRDKFHIAIINRITKINSDIQVQKFRQYPFFAIALKGTPKLTRISREVLNMDHKSTAIDPQFIMKVKIKEDIALVPNLVSFWKIIDTLPSRLQWLGKIIRRGGGSK